MSTRSLLAEERRSEMSQGRQPIKGTLLDKLPPRVTRTNLVKEP